MRLELFTCGDVFEFPPPHVELPMLWRAFMPLDVVKWDIRRELIKGYEGRIYLGYPIGYMAFFRFVEDNKYGSVEVPYAR